MNDPSGPHPQPGIKIPVWVAYGQASSRTPRAGGFFPLYKGNHLSPGWWFRPEGRLAA